MVEFILVLVPFVMVAAWQLSWLADSFERTRLREVAIEVARYSALADVTELDARGYLAQRLQQLTAADATLSYANYVHVRLVADSHQFMNLTNHQLVVNAIAKRELGY